MLGAGAAQEEAKASVGSASFDAAQETAALRMRMVVVVCGGARERHPAQSPFVRKGCPQGEQQVILLEATPTNAALETTPLGQSGRYHRPFSGCMPPWSSCV
jgi:hypothetical protein